jgi:tetratricopeptide (TPR) repeat protein
MTPVPDTPRPPRAAILLAGATIVAAAVAAYHGSFGGPFIFDDLPSIPDNPTIRRLGDLGAVLSPPPGGYTVSGRPVLNLSLAINYALGGTNPWGYHALNLLIHALAGLTLFGIARRTLRLDPSTSLWLGLAIALIWTVHPLQTESVTYVIQRAESLMGLFYLLTLYCFIRYSEPGSRGPWPWLSVGACLLGAATKEVMVSAPVIVLLYDRTFVSGSFREGFMRRRPYYAALSLSWVLLGWLVLASGSRGTTAGVNVGMDPFGYWLTQFPAITHYLRLVFWPAPLVLDYGTSLVPAGAAWPQVAVVSMLALGTLWLLARRPGPEPGRAAAGFALAWFFAILLPTSVVPVVTQVQAEHRMYLALAPVVALLVAGGTAFLGRGFGSARARWIAIPACLAAAAALAVATSRRNEDYRSPLSLWQSTASQGPGNARAQYNLGLALASAEHPDEAIAAYREALRLLPGYTEARNNLGIALTQAGRWPEAIPEYEEAARLDPASGRTRYNLGNALLHIGRLDEAIAAFEEARRLSPGNPSIEYNLGLALTKAARAPEAAAAYRRALALKPDFPDALYGLGRTLAAMGDWAGALPLYEDAARRGLAGSGVPYNRAQALLQLGRVAEAEASYAEALALRPDFPEAESELAFALSREGRIPEAVAHYAAAIRLQPDDPRLHNDLGCTLAQAGRFDEARREFEAALRLAPDDPATRANLARLPAPH